MRSDHSTSAWIQAVAERAALMANAEVLMEKHDLKLKKEQLNCQRENKEDTGYSCSSISQEFSLGNSSRKFWYIHGRYELIFKWNDGEKWNSIGLQRDCFTNHSTGHKCETKDWNSPTQPAESTSYSKCIMPGVAIWLWKAKSRNKLSSSLI